MTKLYKFKWDCGRAGDLEGLFVAEESNVKAAIGRELYFGSVLGKYSEVAGPLEESEITAITDDETFISRFQELKCESGYNPLHYFKE